MSNPKKLFSGVQTALATPFSQGEVDWKSLESLVDDQIQKGVRGLVSVGTTGESPTLSNEEHIGVIQRTASVAAGRVPVIAGTGSNSTQEALELSQSAVKAGADALLLVAPYYNKPNGEGLFHHFSAIAEVVRVPIMLYSIPSRCGIDIPVETTQRLFEKFPHVCAMKEAGGQCDRVTELRAALGSDFTVMSGDDALTLPFISLGANGVVSVASNLFPAELQKMVDAALNGQRAEALQLHEKFADLFSCLFVEPNPVPVKFAMKELGLIRDDEVRLPLTGLSEATQVRLRKILSQLS